MQNTRHQVERGTDAGLGRLRRFDRQANGEDRAVAKGQRVGNEPLAGDFEAMFSEIFLHGAAHRVSRGTAGKRLLFMADGAQAAAPAYLLYAIR